MAQLIVLIYNMADTFFIGRTNDPLMVAGASLILPVFNISLSLAVYRYYEKKHGLTSESSDGIKNEI
ncbi:MAG: hypothetical protein MJ096_03450 [Clostridia bacterium]|nr:hypothetical protein [Clostridia bacterium]